MRLPLLRFGHKEKVCLVEWFHANPRAVAELLDRYIDPRGSVVVGFATFTRA